MFKKWLAALIVGLFALQAPAAERIERVEPSSWWVGMKHPRLQLLVHGPKVAELEPAIDYAGVAITSVERVANPNYLFVNLTVAPDTRPGTVRIDFRRKGRTIVTRNYPLSAREPGSAERTGFGAQDAIYLVMPDRFANGEASNDTVKGLRDGLDRSEPYGRHGGDLQGIVRHLDYVAGMGFTQLWLNPVLENAQSSITYHGYAITDFYKVSSPPKPASTASA
jgi:neopullulanase